MKLRFNKQVSVDLYIKSSTSTLILFYETYSKKLQWRTTLTHHHQGIKLYQPLHKYISNNNFKAMNTIPLNGPKKGMGSFGRRALISFVDVVIVISFCVCVKHITVRTLQSNDESCRQQGFGIDFVGCPNNKGCVATGRGSVMLSKGVY